MILTDKCKEDFSNIKKWYFNLLPNNIKNLIIYEWFNTKTNIYIDLQYWENDGFDYGVQHPYINEVYLSNRKAGNRRQEFDVNLQVAIINANKIYNEKEE